MDNGIRPSRRDASIKDLRGSALGQLHYGGPETYATHPFLSFMIKLGTVLNVGSWVALWFSFRIKDLFPPHDAPFMSAIGWYFVFGGLYCFCAFSFFRFASFVEKRAITQAVTHNRSYNWQSQLGTRNLTDTDLRKVAETSKREQPLATNAGAGYFRTTNFLILAAIASWAIGIYSILADLI